MELKHELEQQKEELNKHTPELIRKYMTAVIEKLKASGIEENALNVGDMLPNGKLIDHNGEKVLLSDILKHKPAIISFYRGAWCPYCNLELRAYDRLLSELSNDSYQMFAISPEIPDQSIPKIDIKNLSFTVLSDPNNKYAKKVGLVYKTTRLLRFLYRLGKINIAKSQGNDLGELPISATYVINKEAIITNAWINVDYTKRAEPREVITFLKLLGEC